METKKILIYAVIVLITGVSIFFYIKKQQRIQNQKKTQEILSKERRDCETGEWSEWSPCSVSCGGGSQSRNRLMKTPAKNGGSCILKETKEGCNTNPCPRDCKVSDWSQYGACQDVNGVFKKKRTKTIIQPSLYGGQECPPISQLTQEEICPFIVTRNVKPSSVHVHYYTDNSGAWWDKTYDNDFNTEWKPVVGDSAWLVFRYDTPVNIEGFKMKFHTYEGDDLSLGNPQILRIYKNVDQSYNTPITFGADLSNYEFPLDSLIYEKTYTTGRVTITLNEKLNLTGVNNIMVMLTKRTYLYEIQFY